MGLVLDVEDQLTGSSFMTSDLDNNQIAGFYPGASSHAASISVREVARGARFGLVGATTLEAMRRHAAEIVVAGCPLIYDPSQQVVALPAEDLRVGIEAASVVVGSDYEFGIVERKTGWDVAAVAARVPLTVVTYGAQGSEIFWRGEATRIPAVPAEPLAEPTGGGDAYRAGLIKGLLLGLEFPIVGRLGSLAATYAVERYGTQEHAYTVEEFVARFNRAFPEYAGAVSVDQLSTAAPAGAGLFDPAAARA